MLQRVICPILTYTSPAFGASVEVITFEFCWDLWHRKLQSLGYRVMLFAVSVEQRRVRQTDRHTTTAYTALAWRREVKKIRVWRGVACTRCRTTVVRQINDNIHCQFRFLAVVSDTCYQGLRLDLVGHLFWMIIHLIRGSLKGMWLLNERSHISTDIFIASWKNGICFSVRIPLVADMHSDTRITECKQDGLRNYKGCLFVHSRSFPVCTLQLQNKTAKYY